MKKYWLIIKNTWEEYATYRLNFVMWRVRMVVRFLIAYFLWSVIYSGNQSYFGYHRESMLTYILLVYLVSNFVLATRTQDLGAIINQGRLTNHLLKPINYFAVLASRDISDKLLNFLFSIFEVIIIYALIKPPVFIQTNLSALLLAIAAFFCSVVLYFFVSTLLGLFGFWTTEVWATRFIFFILLNYLAGSFFPIDILPKTITQILLLTPFPYIFYFPVKIYLGQWGIVQVLFRFFIMGFWTLISIQIVRLTWKKGLQIYSAEGR